MSCFEIGKKLSDYNYQNFLTTGGIISFSKRTLLHVVSLRDLIGRHPSLFLTVN
jgi:hypothetical protein